MDGDGWSILMAKDSHRTPTENLRQWAEATSKAWLQTGKHVAATCSPFVRHGHSVRDLIKMRATGP
jgi:hypothetical protein